MIKLPSRSQLKGEGKKSALIRREGKLSGKHINYCHLDTKTGHSGQESNQNKEHSCLFQPGGKGR